MSGHAVISFGVATLLAPYLTRRWQVVAYLLAVLNITARVYLGAHNPLDVVGAPRSASASLRRSTSSPACQSAAAPPRFRQDERMHIDLGSTTVLAVILIVAGAVIVITSGESVAVRFLGVDRHPRHRDPALLAAPAGTTTPTESEAAVFFGLVGPWASPRAGVVRLVGPSVLLARSVRARRPQVLLARSVRARRPFGSPRAGGVSRARRRSSAALATSARRGWSTSSRAATFSWTCSGRVAPKRTLATEGGASANATRGGPA